ncbi:unnamed protein product [Amoebophrya sp. A25]|nr:unnamed protein product [Amoebophrya sp. A25]|eukprot:GSA25T00009984001.1
MGDPQQFSKPFMASFLDDYSLEPLWPGPRQPDDPPASFLLASGPSQSNYPTFTGSAATSSASSTVDAAAQLWGGGHAANFPAAVGLLRNATGSTTPNAYDVRTVEVSMMLMGSFVFFITLFYLANNKDHDIRRHFWRIASCTITIFLALQVFHLANDPLVEIYVFGGANTRLLLQSAYPEWDLLNTSGREKTTSTTAEELHQLGSTSAGHDDHTEQRRSREYNKKNNVVIDDDDFDDERKRNALLSEISKTTASATEESGSAIVSSGSPVLLLKEKENGNRYSDSTVGTVSSAAAAAGHSASSVKPVSPASANDGVAPQVSRTEHKSEVEGEEAVQKTSSRRRTTSAKEAGGRPATHQSSISSVVAKHAVDEIARNRNAIQLPLFVSEKHQGDHSAAASEIGALKMQLSGAQMYPGEAPHRSLSGAASPSSAQLPLTVHDNDQAEDCGKKTGGQNQVAIKASSSSVHQERPAAAHDSSDAHHEQQIPSHKLQKKKGQQETHPQDGRATQEEKTPPSSSHSSPSHSSAKGSSATPSSVPLVHKQHRTGAKVAVSSKPVDHYKVQNKIANSKVKPTRAGAGGMQGATREGRGDRVLIESESARLGRDHAHGAAAGTSSTTSKLAGGSSRSRSAGASREPNNIGASFSSSKTKGRSAEEGTTRKSASYQPAPTSAQSQRTKAHDSAAHDKHASEEKPTSPGRVEQSLVEVGTRKVVGKPGATGASSVHATQSETSRSASAGRTSSQHARAFSIENKIVPAAAHDVDVLDGVKPDISHVAKGLTTVLHHEVSPTQEHQHPPRNRLLDPAALTRLVDPLSNIDRKSVKGASSSSSKISVQSQSSLIEDEAEDGEDSILEPDERPAAMFFQLESLRKHVSASLQSAAQSEPVKSARHVLAQMLTRLKRGLHLTGEDSIVDEPDPLQLEEVEREHLSSLGLQNLHRSTSWMRDMANNSVRRVPSVSGGVVAVQFALYFGWFMALQLLCLFVECGCLKWDHHEDDDELDLDVDNVEDSPRHLNRPEAEYERAQTKIALTAWASLLGYVAMFAVLHAFSSLQALTNNIGMSFALVTVCPVCLIILWELSRFLRASMVQTCCIGSKFASVRTPLPLRQTRSSTGEGVAEWERLITDIQSENLGIATSFLLVQSLQFLIIGRLPDFHGQQAPLPGQIFYTPPSGVLSVMLLIVVVTALVADFLVRFVHRRQREVPTYSFQSRIFSLVTVILSMTFAWQLLLMLRWIVAHLCATISNMVIFKLVVATFVTLIGMALIIVLDMFEDWLAPHRQVLFLDQGPTVAATDLSDKEFGRNNKKGMERGLRGGSPTDYINDYNSSPQQPGNEPVVAGYYVPNADVGRRNPGGGRPPGKRQRGEDPIRGIYPGSMVEGRMGDIDREGSHELLFMEGSHRMEAPYVPSRLRGAADRNRYEQYDRQRDEGSEQDDTDSSSLEGGSVSEEMPLSQQQNYQVRPGLGNARPIADRRDEPPPSPFVVQDNLEKMILCVGIIIGFAWNHAFEVAMLAVNQEIDSAFRTEWGRQHNLHLMFVLLRILLILLVLPAWRYHVLPQVVRTRDEFLQGRVLENIQDETSAARVIGDQASERFEQWKQDRRVRPMSKFLWGIYFLVVVVLLATVALAYVNEKETMFFLLNVREWAADSMRWAGLQARRVLLLEK